jgi:hypothetical protein
MKKEQPAIQDGSALISIDWLQFYVDTERLKESTIFEGKRKQYGTTYYKNVIEYYVDNIRVASLAYEPRSSILRPNSGQLKIANEVLYMQKFMQLVDALFTDIGIEEISISRLDICADFKKFSGNLMPQELIKKFIECEAWKIGQSKYSLHGKQSSKQTYQTLRFGTHESDVSVYLYNKSLELSQKRNKQYIQDKWRNSGLQSASETWRLEVSLTGSAIKFVDKESGEILAKNRRTIEREDVQRNLYYALIKKYFEFRENTGKSKKIYEKRIQIFDNCETSYGVFIEERQPEVSKRDKILISSLERFNNEARYFHAEERAELQRVQRNVIRRTGLDEWWRRHKQFYQRE